MIYLTWMGQRSQPIGCTVVVLCHCDEYPAVNEAPAWIQYYLPSGGAATTSTAKFGSAALQSPYTSEKLESEFLEPFNGKATIEFWMRRVGGLQDTSGGNGDEQCGYFGNLKCSDGGQLQFWIGYSGANYSTDNIVGSGFQVYELSESGAKPALVDAVWTDDEYHAIAICVDVDAVYMFLDGVLVGTRTLGAPLPTNDDAYWFELIAVQAYTSASLSLDEVRITLNEARYTGDYTPATGPWLTADCDSDTGPPPGPTTALLLHFEDGDLSTSIADSSPYARTLTGNANCKVSTTRAKFGSSSLHITQNDSGGIAIPASADFAGTVTQWCLEFWFYRVVTTNTTQSPSIFILTAGSTVVSVQNLGSSARIATNQGNGQVYVPNPATSNAWHHAAIMFDSSQPSGSDGCICIDGVRELVLDGTGWNSVTASIRLFGSASGSVGAADSTDYWIDELAFWVNHLPFPFAGGFTPPTAPY